jgi:hypothetical protein
LYSIYYLEITILFSNSEKNKDLYKFGGEWVHSSRTYTDVNGVKWPLKKTSARCSKSENIVKIVSFTIKIFFFLFLENDISNGGGEYKFNLEQHYCAIQPDSKIQKYVTNLKKLPDYDLYIEKFLADNSFKCRCEDHPTEPTKGPKPTHETEPDTPGDGIPPVTKPTPGLPKVSRNLSSVRGIRADIRTGKLVWVRKKEYLTS